MGIKVTVQSVSQAGPKQKAITEKACQLLQTALNNPLFAGRVRTASYTATWQSGPAGSRDVRKTPEQILQSIIEGREYGTDKDFEIDVAVEYRKMRRGIVGSTNLGALPIYTSYWFVNDCIAADDAAGLASHFMHEWMHVAGFFHAGGNAARGDVAYVLGEIIGQILSETTELGRVEVEMQ